MAIEDLQDILNFIEERAIGKSPNYKTETNIFIEILERKKDQFEQFKKDIKVKWNDFKLKNQKKVLKKTYTTFFYENFHDFFKYFVENFFGINENSLKIIIKEKISEKILILEYNYFLTLEVKKYFDKISNSIQEDLLYVFSFPAGYLYLLIRLLGIVIRKTINKKIFILLDGVNVKEEEKGIDLNFMIIVKDSKDAIFNSYYDMVLYYFLKYFKGVPEEFYEKLLKGRENLYQIALEEYPNSKENLVDLLYYFYRKCKLLQSFSPILDFINFVGSRVEDSVFSKIDIIKKGFLANMEYSVEKKNSIIKIFNFLDKKSTLYATFQANNLPSAKSQLNLFLLYMKYYFGSGLEALEVSDILFLPELFKTTLNQYNKRVHNVIDSNSIKNIGKFLNFLSIASNIDDIDLFFQKLFKKNVSQLNYGFFRAFLKSLNSNFFDLMDRENKALCEDPNNTPFNFNIIADHICRILYVLIEKIFIQPTPDEASKNFIDPRSRYIGKNIALRVLELFVFQDVNYSDDVWPDYIISLNKEQLKKDLETYKIEIPDKHFYTMEDLTQIMITYNIQSLSDQIFFEEWLLYEIILPIHNFISMIKDSVNNLSNETEVYEKLIEFFLSNTEGKKNLQDFKFLCHQFARVWKNFE
ncbi:MAG: hypothetical protein KAT66_04500 [Candidatus Lokiarchaeota archaeon]|nr:hypothetical protein [Candidatus Lokiarchaeota archaeon]